MRSHRVSDQGSMRAKRSHRGRESLKEYPWMNVARQLECLWSAFPPMPDQSDNPVLPEPRIVGEGATSARVEGGPVRIDPSLIERALIDRTLIDRARAGDERAMAEIFDRYAGLVYSTALRVLQDSGQAEDVTQEIFFQVWRNPERFSASRGSLAAWLLVLARNRAIDCLRQRRYAEPVDEVMLRSATNLESEAERSIIMQRVQSILGDLPSEQQQSLQMAFFEGLSHSEIAERTGQPLGTVKTRIRLALTSLRKRLEA